MKHIYSVLSIFILLGITSAFAQSSNEEKHELKLNALNLVIFKTIDVSYDHIINPNTTFGISILANLQNEPRPWLPHYQERFAVTPYYRHFFMNRYAKGFFLEGFGMFNHQEPINRFIHEDERRYRGESTNFALGIALGGKVVSKRNFVFEFFGGIGRNLFHSDPEVYTEFVPRIGINLGYRF